MTFIIILLTVILIWMIFGDRIKAWTRRRMMEKMEDAFRTSMGMPTAKEERRRRKEAEKTTRKNPRRGSNPYHQYPDSIIPKEYAEDVEFTEYKEFSKATYINKEGGAQEETFETEEQVSDVEFVEIKEIKK